MRCLSLRSGFHQPKGQEALPKLKGLEAGRPGKGNAPKVFWRVEGRLLREKNMISSFHPDAFLLGSSSCGEEEWGDFVSSLGCHFQWCDLEQVLLPLYILISLSVSWLQ